MHFVRLVVGSRNEVESHKGCVYCCEQDVALVPFPCHQDAGRCWTSRAHHFSPKSLVWWGQEDFSVCEGAGGVWGSGSVSGHGAELEGFGAASEAEREGEGQRGRCWRLEGELLQQGYEEDEELGPGELLPGTSPLAWKRSTSNLKESRASSSHLRACTGCGGFSSWKG